MQFVQLVLRFLQFLLTLLITALIGNVITDAFAGNPSSVNYAMFVAVFSWIVLIYGFATAVFESQVMPIVLPVLDGLATLFTFIAGVVLAAKLRIHSCGNASYVKSNSLTDGSHDPSKRCHELQASTAFFWFLFVTYAASMAMTGLSYRSSGMSSHGGIRKGGPSMSQVQTTGLGV